MDDTYLIEVHVTPHGDDDTWSMIASKINLGLVHARPAGESTESDVLFLVGDYDRIYNCYRKYKKKTLLLILGRIVYYITAKYMHNGTESDMIDAVQFAKAGQMYSFNSSYTRINATMLSGSNTAYASSHYSSSSSSNVDNQNSKSISVEDVNRLVASEDGIDVSEVLDELEDTIIQVNELFNKYCEKDEKSISLWNTYLSINEILVIDDKATYVAETSSRQSPRDHHTLSPRGTQATVERKIRAPTYLVHELFSKDSRKLEVDKQMVYLSYVQYLNAIVLVKRRVDAGADVDIINKNSQPFGYIASFGNSMDRTHSSTVAGHDNSIAGDASTNNLVDTPLDEVRRIRVQRLQKDRDIVDSVFNQTFNGTHTIKSAVAVVEASVPSVAVKTPLQKKNRTVIYPTSYSSSLSPIDWLSACTFYETVLSALVKPFDSRDGLKKVMRMFKHFEVNGMYLSDAKGSSSVSAIETMEIYTSDLSMLICKMINVTHKRDDHLYWMKHYHQYNRTASTAVAATTTTTKCSMTTWQTFSAFIVDYLQAVFHQELCCIRSLVTQEIWANVSRKSMAAALKAIDVQTRNDRAKRLEEEATIEYMNVLKQTQENKLYGVDYELVKVPSYKRLMTIVTSDAELNRYSAEEKMRDNAEEESRISLADNSKEQVSEGKNGD